MKGKEQYSRMCYLCNRPRVIKAVRVRVPGKATLYYQPVVFWCLPCLKQRRGRWKYADQPITKDQIAPDYLGDGI